MSEIFEKPKPIIGMVHLENLYSHKGLNYVKDRASGDVNNLQLGGYGVDGLLVENWVNTLPDSPFVSEELAERIEVVTKEILKEARIPVGINVLHNDYRTAFRIAKKLKLPYVQLDVLVDKVVPEHFKETPINLKYIEVDPEDFKKHRVEEVHLFASILPKHYIPHEEQKYKKIEESARQAIKAKADVLVVTGKITGEQPVTGDITKVKDVVSVPVYIGSGLNKDNAPELLKYADGAIMGTGVKIGGKVTKNPVDPRRVEEFMEVVHKNFR